MGSADEADGGRAEAVPGAAAEYSAWLRDTDLTSTYAYEQRVLKMLQWGMPTGPWRLKCPSHLLWLGVDPVASLRSE